jgi:hypothetical protein
VNALTGEGLGRRLRRALSGAARALGVAAAARARERERRNELGLRVGVGGRGFVRPKTARDRRIEMNGSRSPDRLSAQAGFHFPGPGPGCGLERGTRGARAGRGLFLRLGPFGGLRRGEESESERATGRFWLRAVCRPGTRNDFARSGPRADFGFGLNSRRPSAQ